MTDPHALIRRLADELDRYRQLLTDDRTERHPLAAEARAVLARFGRPTLPLPNDLSHLSEEQFQALCPHGYHGVGDGPAVPEGREPASVEQQATADDLPPCVGHVLRLAEIIREVDGSHGLGAAALAEAILNHPGFSQCCEPAPPPADGEVGELVNSLRHSADALRGFGLVGGVEVCTRAADLLTRLAPQPQPVSERLPGPEDCDAEGRCWWGDAGNDEFVPSWRLCERPDKPHFSHWLPFHALPLPGAVQP